MASQVFTFFSLKGGDGKTTSCANIGISLGIIKKGILLIDLDPIANLTASFVQESTIECDSSDLFKKDIDIKKIAIRKVANNVDLIPANPCNLQYMFLETKEDKDAQFAKNLEILKQKYDFILIDTAATINEVNQIILNYTTSILFPMTCEQFSLNTIPNIFAVIRKTQITKNPNLKIEGVIITKFNKKTTTSLSLMTEINKIFDGYVYDTNIPVDSYIPKYYLANKNIVQAAPWTPSAIAYTTLTKEILNRNKVKNNNMKETY